MSHECPVEIKQRKQIQTLEAELRCAYTLAEQSTNETIKELRAENERLTLELEDWQSARPDCGCPDSDDPDQYAGWACFHCGDIFCDKCAPEHFGVSEGGTACQDKQDILKAENERLKTASVNAAFTMEHVAKHGNVTPRIQEILRVEADKLRNAIGDPK